MPEAEGQAWGCGERQGLALWNHAQIARGARSHSALPHLRHTKALVGLTTRSVETTSPWENPRAMHPKCLPRNPIRCSNPCFYPLFYKSPLPGSLSGLRSTNHPFHPRHFLKRNVAPDRCSSAFFAKTLNKWIWEEMRFLIRLFLQLRN